ncbi:ATP-binding protein [Aquibacillus salsiterrae]|uniref:AAA family ATPase n=1 Tax=Aquibacillus salsiterrae TaxID=2950439 RepID=A0A9X3WE03_9BACI|nr:AAA family ATPase [Aquibacillus salsiterrae]MDC3417283.1 AAA family ATPase [Aquibacillus salsiterrae]
MRVKRANIYGFGKWQDYQIDFPDTSLVVINGANESGKSTLRQFLLFMLFGFPPKKRELYMPKTGGRMGGQLTVSTESDGVFSIERIHDRRNGEAVCWLADGTVMDEEWLKIRLNGIDEKTYNSIFSFDAKQLTTLDNISREQLGDVLLGIGMAGTEKIYTIEKELENELNDLFKPQGRRPTINECLNEIARHYTKMKELEIREIAYNDKKRTERELAEEINLLQRELVQLTHKRDSYHKLIDMYPLIEDYHHTVRELSLYPEQLTFPENGFTRYQQVKEYVLPLRSELFAVTNQLKDYHEHLTMIQAQMLSASVLEQLKYTVASFDSYAITKKQMEEKNKEVTHLKQTLTNELSTLEIGFTVDNLATLSFPFHVEETWFRLKQELEQIEQEKDNIANELSRIDHQMNQLLTERNKLENEQIEEHSLGQFIQKVEKKEAHNQREPETYKQTQWQQFIENDKKINHRTLVIAGILSALIILVGWFANQPLLLLVSIVLVSIVVFFQSISKRRNKWMDNLFDVDEARTEIISDDEYYELKEMVSRQEQIKQHILSMNNELHQLEVDRLKRKERQRFFNQKKSATDQYVQEEIAAYPFLQGVSVKHWPLLYRRLSVILDKYEQMVEKEEQFNYLCNQNRNYEQDLFHWIEKKGLMEEKQTIENAVVFLKELLKEQTRLSNQHDHYTQLFKQLNEQERELNRKLLPYNEELQQLFSIAAVTNEEDFLKKGKQAEAKKQLNDKLIQLKKQLETVVTNSNINQLEETDIAFIKGKYDQITQTMTEMDGLLESKRQALADIRSVIHHLENSEDFSMMKHRYANDLDRLQHLAKKWAVLTVAKDKLTETKNVYQDKYLPKVIEQTSTYFRRLTFGRYVQVYPPIDKHSIQVEDERGIRFTAEQLSQGTRDQLYVALRIALSTLSNSDANLPFFIDDAFVHFDHRREQVMFDILVEVSNNQQVIVFTYDQIWKDYANKRSGVFVKEVLTTD